MLSEQLKINYFLLAGLGCIHDRFNFVKNNLKFII